MRMYAGHAAWRCCGHRSGFKGAKHAIKVRCACASGRIAMDRPRFGYLRVLVMLQREGWSVGKKRALRLYRLEGLQLRMKVKRRKRISLQRGRPMPATGPNQHWSMDFVHDQMLDGRAFRVLTVIRAVESPEV